MKTVYYRLFMVCLLFLLIINMEVVAQTKFTPSQLKSDFSLFKQALKEAHPGLYRYNSKKQIDSLFNRTESTLNHDMTQQEFYQTLLPVAVQLKCGHTKLHPDSNWGDNYFYGSEKLFPLRLFIRDHKAYVLGSYENNEKVPAGAEVTAINNQPVDQIIDTLLAGFFSDGNNTTFKYIEMGKYFSAYYANLIESPDSFAISCLKDNEQTQIKLPAIPRTKIELYENNLASQQLKIEPYSIEFPSDKVAKLTISSFWENGKDLSYPRFLKKAFAEINDKGIQHLIIDVRDNEGGKDKRGALLLSYLMDKEFRYYDRLEASTNQKYSFAKQAHLPKFYGILRMLISKTSSGTYLWKHNKNLKVQKPQKHPYSEKVYVLTNGASFSVTAEFAAVTHYLKRATFIGEETGGGYYGNNSGTFVIVPLPNSRLVTGIPMLAYYTAVKEYPFADRGLIPDYEVKPGVKDILEGKDAVLDFTLNLIGNVQRPHQALGYHQTAKLTLPVHSSRSDGAKNK